MQTPQAPVYDENMVAPESLASPSQRFTGRFVDNLVMLLPLVLGIVLAITVGRHGETTGPLMIVGLVLGIALYAGAQWMQLRSTGQTLGKRVAGTRVLAVDGSPVGPWRACFFRDGLLLVANATRILGIINGLTVFQASRRCIHDHILGTVVVDVNKFAAQGQDFERVAEVFR